MNRLLFWKPPRPPDPAVRTAAPTSHLEADGDDGLGAADDDAGGTPSPAAPAHDGRAGRRVRWANILVYGVLPAVVIALTVLAAVFKWREGSGHDAQAAAAQSVQSARDSVVALLSYRPDTVEAQLGSARDLLTGAFRDSYTSLTHDIVIPGAHQKQVSATASVPAAASVSATPEHAVVLVFVDQSVIVGASAPTQTASSVRVTLDKVGPRWLISAFDPV